MDVGEQGKENSIVHDNQNKEDQDKSDHAELVKQTNNSLRILSYNVFLRPPPVKNNEDDYKDQRLKLFIDTEMENFDIICFQELFRLLSTRRHKMIYSAIKKGFLYHASSPSPSLFSSYVVDAGVAILSRNPIVEQRFRPYTYGIVSDGICQKGVLYAKILLNNKYIHLFNTHTQASYPTTQEEIKMTVLTRLEQFMEMRQAVEDCLKEFNFQSGDICLLIGDFNVDARHPKHPVSFIADQPEMIKYLELNASSLEQFDEYEALTYILSGKRKDTLIDVIKQSHNGQSQTTFADVYIDEKGTSLPLETALTDKRDLLSTQSLDYIMQLIPKGTTSQSQSDITGKLSMDFKESRTDKFFVKNQKFTQLSDHYGVSSVVQHNNQIS